MQKKDKCWFETWFNSPYYHVLYKNRDVKEAELFIDKLLGILNLAPAAHVLDYACGKGRHAIYLNSKGFEVDGVDLSTENILSAKAHEQENLHFYIHDIRNVLAVNVYDAVFNLFTSMGYFEHLHDNFRVIQSASTALKKGGTLVIDFLNPDYVLKNMKAEEKKVVDGIEFIIRKQHSNGVLTKKITVVNKGVEQHFEEVVSMLNNAYFMDMIKKAGLTCEYVFGNYALNAYDASSSERMIFVLKK